MNYLEYNSLTDEHLIEKILEEGKTELFSIIYNRYFPKVKDKCFSFLKNNARAEEFANDILSKVFEKLNSFKGKSHFSSWLYSISYNMIIDFLRKKRQVHYPSWNQSNELPEIIDESLTDVNELNYENLMVIFEKLHPEEKALLLMKYQDGLALRQIASSLVISEDAVKMRLKRARSRVMYLYYKQFGND